MLALLIILLLYLDMVIIMDKKLFILQLLLLVDWLDNRIYYTSIVDKNTIKLSNNYYDSINLDPKVINITSASAGTISPINPPIKLEKKFKEYILIFLILLYHLLMVEFLIVHLILIFTVIPILIIHSIHQVKVMILMCLLVEE